MGCLRFDGVDDSLRWDTLAQAIKDCGDGAFTVAMLIKRAGSLGTWQSLWGGLSGTVTHEYITGIDDFDNDFYMDGNGAAQVAPNSTLGNTTDTHLLVSSKGAGTVVPRLGKSTNGGTMTHENHSGAGIPDQIDFTRIEFGVWDLSEFFNGWLGVLAMWEGEMSDANKALLETNWQTSDLWQSAHGQPVMLVEFNVATGSLVDLAANASGLVVGGSPTLDSGETLNSWNFNGTGTPPVAPATVLTYTHFPRFQLAGRLTV